MSVKTRTEAPVKSRLRLEFEEHLSVWNSDRQEETNCLFSLLVIWCAGRGEEKTIWEHIEERITAIVEHKNAINKRRPRDISWDGNKIICRPETPESVTAWLFRSPTADEWMKRFRQKF